MRKSLLLILALSLFIPASAFADTFYLDSWQPDTMWVYQGHLTDYCWAASAAETLAWARYETPSYPTTDAIFSSMTSHFPDQPGSPPEAWTWYVGKNWSGAGPTPYFYSSGDPVQWAASQLQAGNAVAILDSYPGASLGHVMAMWGYTYAGAAITGVYLTDSQDITPVLDYFPLSGDTMTDGWYFNSVITFAWSLERNMVSVPEPSALLLLVSGLIGLVEFREILKK